MLLFFVCVLVTDSAKELALKRNIMKKSVKKHSSIEKSIDPFDSMEMILPPGSTSSLRKLGDQWNFSSIKTKFSSLRKANSLNVAPLRDYPEETFSRRRDKSITASIFYDDDSMAVTKNLSEPADFNPLDLKGKTMNELLMLLKPVIIAPLN